MADERELCTVVRKGTTTTPPPCSNTPGDAPDTPTKPRALIVETSPNPPQTHLGLQEPPYALGLIPLPLILAASEPACQGHRCSHLASGDPNAPSSHPVTVPHSRDLLLAPWSANSSESMEPAKLDPLHLCVSKLFPFHKAPPYRKSS